MNSVNSPALLTQAEFAAHRGVRPSAVSNWKSRGLLVMAEDPAHPGKLLVDVARSDARINGKVDPTRGRPSKGGQAQGSLALAPNDPPGQDGGGDQLASERLELIREQKIKARMANAREAGQLVPLEEYERRSSELGRLARERMHAMARLMGETLAAETDSRQVTAILDTEIDRVFGELAEQLEAGLGDQAADDLDAALIEAAEAAEDGEPEA